MRKAPKLKYWREAKGLTQEQLSEIADVARQTISNLENDKSASPGTLAKLARALTRFTEFDSAVVTPRDLMIGEPGAASAAFADNPIRELAVNYG